MKKQFLLLAILAIMLIGCRRDFVRPNIPATVTVAVEKTREIPEWATLPLLVPKPADRTVGERLRAGDQAVFILDKIANCHRELLRRLSAGENIADSAIKECKL